MYYVILSIYLIFDNKCLYIWYSVDFGINALVNEVIIWENKQIKKNNKSIWEHTKGYYEEKVQLF